MNRVILFGQGASGKDWLRKRLTKYNFEYQPSYSTRTKRNNEIDGEDYFFLDKEKFEQMIKDDLFYEYITFGENYYGSTKEQFYKNNSLFIMTPKAVDKLSELDRKTSIVIFLDINEDIRKERLKERGLNEEQVEARLEEDRKTFDNITNYDVRITDHNFTVKDIMPHLT